MLNYQKKKKKKSSLLLITWDIKNDHPKWMSRSIAEHLPDFMGDSWLCLEQSISNKRISYRS